MISESEPESVCCLQTRILVTHNVQLLERVDLIVVLDRCRVSEVGTYDELLTKDGAFADFVRSYLYEETGEYSTDSDGISYIFIDIYKNVMSFE